MGDKLIIADMHWINKPNNLDSVIDNLSIRIRHGGELLPIKKIEMKKSIIRIQLSTPAFAIAPGQAVVIYQKDQVLGGGVIS